MELLALKLLLSEHDLNELLRRYLPPDQPIEQLAIRITPAGVTIAGVYPLFINVHFETRWALSIEEGQVAARLDNFKAMGVPGNIFKSAIVKMIEDAAGTEEWLQIKGDTIRVDVDRCIGKYAFAAKTHFKAVECRTGEILITGQAD